MPALINGKMLKTVRSQRRLSQQDLAEVSHVGIATIKRIESSSNAYSCRKTSALRLAKALNVNPEDLAEDNFQRILDIGEDLELHLEPHIDIEGFRRQTEDLIPLFEIRNRVLNKKID